MLLRPIPPELLRLTANLKPAMRAARAFSVSLGPALAVINRTFGTRK